MQKKITSSIVLIALLFFSFLVKAETSVNCSLRRKIVEESGKSYYIVGQRARTLYMISRDLYGDEKNWKEIAQNNQIISPYKLEIGQKLFIATPPILDEEKGNEVLIRAWGKLDKPSMVNRLTHYSSDYKDCNPKKVVMDFSAPSEPVTPNALPTPPLKDPLTEPAPSVEAIVAATEVSEPEHHEEIEAHHAWGYSAAITGSSFRLSSTEVENDVNHTLKSKLNPGLQLGLHYEKNEKLTLSFGAGIEQIQFETPDDGTVLEKDQQPLLNFSFETEYGWTSYLDLYAGFLYVQRPFYRITTTGATIDPVYLPEVFVGDHLRIFEVGSGKLSLVTEISYSFPVKDPDHDVKAGYGYIAGLKFDYKLNHSTISFLPAYRFLKEDTETAKEQQEALTASLGYEW